MASGLDITSSGPTSIEKASGQSVKLDCQFSLAPQDSGPLDIEWSLLASDNQKEDKVVRVAPCKSVENIVFISEMAHKSIFGSSPFSGGILFSTSHFISVQRS